MGGQHPRRLKRNNNTDTNSEEEVSTSASGRRVVAPSRVEFQLIGKLKSLKNLIQSNLERERRGSPLCIAMAATTGKKAQINRIENTRKTGRGRRRRRRKRGEDKTEEEVAPGKESKDHRIRPKLDALSGAAAGCLVSIFLHPVDTVKVLVQTELGQSRSLLQVFSKLVTSSGGPQRLYYGLGANLASSMPISAIYTSSYEAAKHGLGHLIGREEERGWIRHCLAGASASVATSFVYTPSECVKNQVQAGIYTKSSTALYQIVTTEGPMSLYRAWPAVLLRNVPQSIAKFFAYEQLKLAVARQTKREPNTTEMLAIGGVAGASGALFSTPFDVVKTRMQTQVGKQAQMNLSQTLKTVLAKEGVAGLYRGLVPRLFIYLSQGAIFFSTYEVLRRATHSLGKSKQQQGTTTRCEDGSH
jgi:hypothetical protein